MLSSDSATCLLCEPTYYNSNGQCLSCPENAAALVVVGSLVFLGLSPILYRLSQTDAFTYFQLGLLFIQVNSVFLSIRSVHWSALHQEFAPFLNLFVFDIPSVHCFIDMPQNVRFFVAMALPLAAAVVFAFVALVLFCYRRSSRGLSSAAYRLAGIFTIVMYIPLTERALSVFEQAETESNVRVMHAYADVQLWTALSYVMVATAVVFLLLFTVGAPVWIGYQILRGWMVNLGAPLHFLVHHFTRRCRWWEIVLLTTKLGVVSVAELVEDGVVAMAIILAWLLLVEVGYLWLRPFESKRANWSFVVVLGGTVGVGGIGLVVSQLSASQDPRVFAYLWITCLSISVLTVVGNLMWEAFQAIRGAWRNRHARDALVHDVDAADEVDNAAPAPSSQVELLDIVDHDQEASI
jgi:hypothetical protein